MRGRDWSGAFASQGMLNIGGHYRREEEAGKNSS
jgi:hypothetical protein